MEIVTITEARRRLHGALSSYQKETEEVTPEAAVGRITARDITAAIPIRRTVNPLSTAMPFAVMKKRL